MTKKLPPSATEDEKKEVLEEYMDRIVIQPSKEINHFETVITYRVLNDGGELGLCKTTILHRVLLRLFVEVT